MQSKNTIQTVSDIYTYITFGEPKRCIHRFDSHTLICVYSGELEIISEGKQTWLKSGNCAFIAARQMAQVTACPSSDNVFRAVMLSLPRCFVSEFYHTLRHDGYAYDGMERTGFSMLPDCPEFQSLFQSLKPYHDTSGTIQASLCRLKMAEGIYALLNTDRRFFITLFDDIIGGKLDILDILNESIGNEMSWRAIKHSTI